MTDSPLDAAPVDGLERAFRLPGYISEDPEMETLYTEMVNRLRREAQGLPMNTIQQVLIERIASFYVQIKYREDHDSFVGVNQQKEFNTYWLSLTAEFNKLLQASDDKLRQAMLIEIQGIVVEALTIITNPDERRAARRKLADDFAAIGI